MKVDRRSFLAAAIAGFSNAVAGGVFASRALAGSAPFVSNDVGALQSVVVHTPGAEGRRGLGLGGSANSIGNAPLSEDAAVEHRAFVDALRAAGAEVIEIRRALDEACEVARSRGALQPWLRAWMPAMSAFEKEVDGEALLGATKKFAYRLDPDGDFLPANDPVRSIYFTRDAGAMTPRGMVISNFANEARTIEAALYRFAFDHAPRLAKYPIAFDAVEERLTLEGGDLMVADERTLFLGVGNRSNPAVARRLAQRLNMDVLAVQMPSGSNRVWSDAASRTPIHNLMLHLDTIATFVDRRRVLALPWFLESKYEGKDPLTRMLRGMSKLPRASEADIDRMCAALRDLGKVRLFRAGSGEADTSVNGMKLVDYLRSRGIEVTFAGGAASGDKAGDETSFEELAQFASEVVIRELRGQAANVVATSPGKVIAYAGNPATLDALKRAGVEVTLFKGTELGRNNGGPHCMTMPLERRS
jgi:arginine deiminase